MRTLMRALGKFWGSTTRLSLPTKFFIGAAALAAVIWLGTWIAADITAHTARFTGSAADSLARATLARSKEEAGAAGTLFGGFGGLALILLLYFLPLVIANGRQHRSAGGIGTLNLLLGWTVIGWIIALIWECSYAGLRQEAAAPRAGGGFCATCGHAIPAGAAFCPGCGAQAAHPA